ncbi:serine/threonine-protein kinase [Isosphaeraceae bacterium EP7]
MDVCNEIACAHSRGVLHRDLKPGNVMLGQYGETLVVDWGLAKVIGRGSEDTGSEPTLRPEAASGSGETLPGTALGTPAYMSPEQAEGRFDRLGPRSDVYSLGATLYCLLTGRAPFQDEDVGAVLRRVRRGDFASPRRVNAAVPRPLEAVCLKAMTLEPAARYASAKELAEDIEHWLADEPVSAYRETASEGLLRQWRRNPRAVALGAALVMVMAVGGVAGIALWQRAEQQRRYGQRLEVAYRDEQAAKHDAVTNLYFNRIALADREWLAGNVRNAERLLEECPRSLRGWEWDHLKQLCHAELVDFRGHDDEVWGVSYSRDGGLIASAGRDGTVRIWDSIGVRDPTSFRHRGPVWAVAFSPDARRVVTASGMRSDAGAVTIWDVATGREIHSLGGRTGSLARVTFSPDGSRVAASSGLAGRNEVVIWDAATGREVQVFREHDAPVSCVAYRPDGRLITSATGSNDDFDPGKKPGEVKLWEVETGRVV